MKLAYLDARGELTQVDSPLSVTVIGESGDTREQLNLAACRGVAFGSDLHAEGCWVDARNTIVVNHGTTRAPRGAPVSDLRLRLATYTGEPGEATVTLLVHDYHCSCGGCGYGGFHWIESFERDELVEQEMARCPGCGARFTARRQGPEARGPAPGYLGDYGEAA